MPFEQQVHLGNQAVSAAAHLSAPPQATQQSSRVVVQNTTTNECKKLDARIQYLDSMARQALPAATQDQISYERTEARSRQFHLRCR